MSIQVLAGVVFLAGFLAGVTFGIRVQRARAVIAYSSGYAAGWAARHRLAVTVPTEALTDVDWEAMRRRLDHSEPTR